MRLSLIIDKNGREFFKYANMQNFIQNMITEPKAQSKIKV